MCVCTFLSSYDMLVAPNITSRHDRTNIQVGEFLLLPCIAEGFPVPKVSWSVNYTALPICTTTIINMGILCAEVNERSAAVLILFADTTDSGWYTCTAENAAGTAVYEVLVTVEVAKSKKCF